MAAVGLTEVALAALEAEGATTGAAREALDAAKRVSERRIDALLGPLERSAEEREELAQAERALARGARRRLAVGAAVEGGGPRERLARALAAACVEVAAAEDRAGALAKTAALAESSAPLLDAAERRLAVQRGLGSWWEGLAVLRARGARFSSSAEAWLLEPGEELRAALLGLGVARPGCEHPECCECAGGLTSTYWAQEGVFEELYGDPF